MVRNCVFKLEILMAQMSRSRAAEHWPFCRGMLEFAYFPGFEGQHDWQFDQEAENARGEKIPHADRHKKPDGPAVRRSRTLRSARHSRP